MNPSQALAEVLVDELVRGGVQDAVLSPGSRNAPLAYALHEADRQGRLRLHVRIDERSAGFLALGLAKASGLPVIVTCTSGTAVANLHPAVLEASHSGVPLVALTADRPTELWGTGANQTTEQVGIFGKAVRAAFAISAPETRSGQVAGWRALVCRALAAATGELNDDPGPVQVDIGFREPLVPAAEDDGQRDWPESLQGRPLGEPWTRVSLAPPAALTAWDGDVALGSSYERTLVLVGDCRPETRTSAARLAATRGWPLLAEPSGVPEGPEATVVLPHGVLLLGVSPWLEAHRPQRVLVVGHVTLSRPVQQLLADPGVVVEVVTESPRWPDAARRAAVVHHRSWLDAALRSAPELEGTLLPTAATGDRAWAQAWRHASDTVADAVAAAVAEEQEGGANRRVPAPSWPSGVAVARVLAESIPRPATLVLGSSSPVRDVDTAVVPEPGLRILANRGLAGIDGTVSTALGVALDDDSRPTYALLGDLTFLHDSNGLVIGPDEPRCALTIVVVNDDGGSIFGLLEQGSPEVAEARPSAFERVFGTPHGVDLPALCAATGVVHVAASTPEDLQRALAQPWGGDVRVIEVKADRSAARALGERVRQAVAAALSRQ
ncbi:MAG: 2-succinyl-5-enolpyruvyl-6-hydroxy-3-cyclohexene-1-carboxylic-acid synthase [Actinomycetales bacterium]